MAWYTFIPRALPGPGTGNYAVLPATSLPPITAGGPGRTYLHGFRVFTEPQAFAPHTAPLAGLAGGGQVAGQYASQGLVNLDAYIANVAAAGANNA